MGGADTVIEGFLAAVGTSGTVAVPTLCRMPDGERHLTFARWNIATSPSCVGHITEVLRHRPDAVRSDHGTHSVSAIGPRAQELTADHGMSRFSRCRAMGSARLCAGEPLGRSSTTWNVAYCFLGVNFHFNTMVHLVESLLVERALQRAAPEQRDEAGRANHGLAATGACGRASV